ncbi:MAG: polysaccharide deacetylase family protein [Bacteroidales bacterium]|nr:polysaccharide deacetylase family protein [Bacteroidales bacterium]
MRKFYSTIAVLLILLFAIFLLFQISKSRTFQFFGELVYQVNTEQKVVALTFDDAPTQKVYEVLKILKQKGIKATFYETGKLIEDNQNEARAIVNAGMEVGNHSYSHKRMILKSWSYINDEIQKTNILIHSSGYQKQITFRPPNGKKLFLLP